MKKAITCILIGVFTVMLCAVALVSCKKDDSKNSDDTIKITKSELEDALAESEGTLTIDGSNDDVKSFTYVVSDVNAEKLSDKSYVRNAVETLLEDYNKITYGQYLTTRAFQTVIQINALFSDKNEQVDSSYISEMLDIICDGKQKTYKNWTFFATINLTDDSIVFTATSK